MPKEPMRTTIPISRETHLALKRIQLDILTTEDKTVTMREIVSSAIDAYVPHRPALKLAK